MNFQKTTDSYILSQTQLDDLHGLSSYQQQSQENIESSEIKPKEQFSNTYLQNSLYLKQFIDYKTPKCQKHRYSLASFLSIENDESYMQLFCEDCQRFEKEFQNKEYKNFTRFMTELGQELDLYYNDEQIVDEDIGYIEQIQDEINKLRAVAKSILKYCEKTMDSVKDAYTFKNRNYYRLQIMDHVDDMLCSKTQEELQKNLLEIKDSLTINYHKKFEIKERDLDKNFDKQRTLIKYQKRVEPIIQDLTNLTQSLKTAQFQVMKATQSNFYEFKNDQFAMRISKRCFADSYKLDIIEQGYEFQGTNCETQVLVQNNYFQDVKAKIRFKVNKIDSGSLMIGLIRDRLEDSNSPSLPRQARLFKYIFGSKCQWNMECDGGIDEDDIFPRGDLVENKDYIIRIDLKKGQFAVYPPQGDYIYISDEEMSQELRQNRWRLMFQFERTCCKLKINQNVISK